jgi:hypothetical protein
MVIAPYTKYVLVYRIPATLPSYLDIKQPVRMGSFVINPRALKNQLTIARP